MPLRIAQAVHHAARVALALALLAAAAALWTTGARAGEIAADPDLVLDIEGGARPSIVASGILPAGLGPRRVRQLLPGVRTDGLGTGASGDAEAWARAIEAINVVLPRIDTARVRLGPGRLAATGRLRPGFSLKGTRPALRVALGPDWTLEFTLAEVPPTAALRFVKDAGGIRLEGILPRGLSVNRALVTLGADAAEGLTSGGAGDPVVWAGRLAVLHRLLRAYGTATGRLGPDALEIEGALGPGQTRRPLSDWAQKRLGSGIAVSLAGEPATPRAGDIRYDPLTRQTARFDGARWRPVYAFAPSVATCDEAALDVLATSRIAFVEGDSRFDSVAARAIDAIADLAAHCLEGTALVMEIGGHTDAVGQPRHNLALSRERADAVRRALLERGVPAERVVAVGHGDTAPVADNATAAGRALNRRITVTWRRDERAAADDERPDGSD